MMLEHAHTNNAHSADIASQLSFAHSATWHCLMGCGIGEVVLQVVTPGVMAAGLDSWIFWLGMGLALAAGYVAAFPVNYVLVGKGIRHVH
jgi:hypothetical protein